MLNLLPQENRKDLKREYRLRLLVVAGIFLLIIGAFTGLFLLSSFLISISRQDAALATESELQKVEASQSASGVSTALIQAKDEMTLVSSMDNGTSTMSAALDLALSHQTSGTSITGVTIDRTNPADPLVTLNGIAADRNSLVTFSNALDSEPLFTSVNVPISDFTQESDIPFSLSFNVKLKKG